ncbi:NYN domain-containing protein [uncultured Nocardioides sp.]|uniref:NYN domain-containing protein n=1 Tax=uncultured Nocardioides sp. TaxID=198441 RepID=UPI00262F7896|nr:NYN domain-containing protein [uncultured Nocardioides sp.]
MSDTKRNGLPKEAVEPTGEPLAGSSQRSATATPLQLSQRVAGTIVYVDGFNLYHGVREKFGRRLLWLDLMALANSLLRRDQRLLGVKYFSAPVRNAPDSQQRQSAYLGALRATGVEVVLGRFQEQTIECYGCHDTWRAYEEKQSDVNFCVQVLSDAHNHAFQTALLVTGDSDMVPAVRAVKAQEEGLRVVAAFPPARYSADLAAATDASFHINASKIRGAQFPERVEGRDRAYLRPTYWS